jgi:hypothetical protein
LSSLMVASYPVGAKATLNRAELDSE